MKRAAMLSVVLGAAMLGGCAATPRREAPPDLIDAATPVGFAPDIRLLTVDRARFRSKSPALQRGIRDAATDGSLDILALSGGGAGGAFGAGALVGLSRAHARPQFELVTGVSAGALIAPFAFLGPQWDAQLAEAFSGKYIERLQHSPGLGLAARILFPRGIGANPLAALVDHYVTDAMIDAVARAAAGGRKLIVATTDLDKQETVLWDMGAIAAHGGEAALRLFRDVLVASASVPGYFPPVLIRVRDGDRIYDELHVDGSVTTPLFASPLIAQILPEGVPRFEGANLYMIVNGQLATTPSTTPINTLDVLERSFSAQLTYKTRDALVLTLALTRRQHMRFNIADIPVEYPFGSFLDFSREHMRALFRYAAGCAARGMLWASVEQSIRHNLYRRATATSLQPACPALHPARARNAERRRRPRNAADGPNR